MSWYLDTLIDFSGHPFECVKTLTDFFEADLNNIQYTVTTGSWPDDKTLLEGELVWSPNTLSELEQLLKPYFISDNYRFISVGLGLYGYGEFGGYSPYPEIQFESQSQRIVSELAGNESDAVLMFGPYQAYKTYKGEDNYVLPKSGRTIDMNLVVQTLEHICQTIQPKNLYLLSEQQIYIPWNYHFIFHNDLEGYAQDLADTIQLVLHGGNDQYIDGRRDYEVGVSDNPGMTFCRRNREHMKVLQDYMLECGTQIEQQEIPETLSRELIEDALLETSTILDEGKLMMDFFFVGNGLGVYTQPLINRYLDLFFLALMSRVRGEGAFSEALDIA
jgi:hypothetical protein